MEKSAQILGFTTAIILFLSWALTSYKTGITYGPQASVRNSNLPKYEIDKTKAEKFTNLLVGASLVNIAYCFIFTREIAAVLIFSALNMAGITYFLTYTVLFKEKKSKK